MFTKGIIFCIFIFLHIHPSLNLCIEHEMQALIKIEKDMYDPDDWLSSWRIGGDCCNWHRITCNNKTGHVIGLDLHYPYDWSSKKPGKSKLNPSFVDLKHLTHLDLSHNNFFGAPIPKFIGSLTRLEYLDLSSSGFKGTIPPQLGNLSSLQKLVIYNSYDDNPNDYNDDSIDLRVDNLHWLSGLTFLTSLVMSSVDLSAAVDWFHDITKLPFISFILFGGTRLSSIPMTIPPLNNFTSLQILALWGNKLNSTIPSWLFYNISSLEALLLGNCGLYGELPLFSGQVSNLKHLGLQRNEFDDQILRHLDRLPLLEELNLRYNYIDASISEIPHSLFNITKLSALYLSNNSFSGRIPKSFANLNNLICLDLSNNILSGPVFFRNLTSLKILDLSSNFLSGTLPVSQNISSQLGVLNLSNNLFSGTIPDLFKFHPFLKSLQLGKNKLHGLIPSSLKYCKKLMVLDVSENKLYGKIPPWIGRDLSSLKILSLRSNGFTGQIPKELSYLTSIQILDLSNNYLSGNFSLYFDNFTLMTKSKKPTEAKIQSKIYLVLKVSDLWYIWLNKQGIVRQYSKSTLMDAIVIDISSNELSGEISNGITKLTELKFLYMARNHFIGNIPKNIDAMKNLEVLDLSSNELSGEIPFTMTGMTSLCYLNLSDNKLSGKIPTGNQFETFNNPSIYSGNKNLCGRPLPECVGSNSSSTNSEGQENEIIWISAGAVIGFLISFWGIFITLMLNQSIRHLHFYYVDKLYEWICLKFYFCIAKIKSKVMGTEMH